MLAEYLLDGSLSFEAGTHTHTQQQQQSYKRKGSMLSNENENGNERMDSESSLHWNQ